MKTTDKLLLISGASLAVCIGAAVAAGMLPTSSDGGRPNWDLFGNQTQLIIFVALPAGIVAAVSAFAALGTYMIDRQRHGQGK